MTGTHRRTVRRTRGTHSPRSARRGLSTSASFLIVLVGALLAFGTLYSAAGNAGERLVEAGDDQRERHGAVQLTAVNVTEAVWDAGGPDLTVRVTNTGDTTLSVPGTDTVVDGTYVGLDAYERVEVDGQDSDVWRPGEQLVLSDSDPLATLDGQPARVRVVTETGVADAVEVTEP